MFSDIKLLWSKNGKLSFRAYSKPGQKIVYVEIGSTHRRLCLRAIPNGVFKRLTRLTSKDNSKIATSTINNLYPDHIEALKKLKLLPSQEFPKLPK